MIKRVAIYCRVSTQSEIQQLDYSQGNRQKKEKREDSFK